MSLRVRLVAVILLALLLSFAAGAGLAAWRAVRTVETELASALAVGRASAGGALKAASADGILDEAEMRRIVAAYDGDRHLVAELRNRAGLVLAASTPASAGLPPRWFLGVVSPALAPAVIAAGDDDIVLTADPANESFERWNELRHEIGLLALFCVAAASFCSMTAARSLRPLTGLSRGLARLGRGDRDVCIPATGPPEIAALAGAFNALSAALQAARDQNLSLHMQAELLAEEERAEIARDLHDEVGPLLFAITAFAATIGRLARDGECGAIPPQLRAIHEATADIQTRVRDMLGRLHDVAPESTSLAERLEGLVTFWRKVQPAMDFCLRVDPGVAALAGRIAEVITRVAQESLSNAVRHGQPRRVTVSVRQADGEVVLVVGDDGRGGPESPGHGLVGMRARLAAIGGRLDIVHGKGWIVEARMPADLLGACAPDRHPAAAE